MNKTKCSICQKSKSPHDMVMAVFVRPAVAALISKDYPEWSEKSQICKTDLNHYRALMIEQMLEKEKGELSSLDQQVLKNIRNQELLSDNPNEQYIEQTTFGNRLADKIAAFGGSWKFIISFGIILLFWVLANVYLLMQPFDPYPFILLNLVLSSLAALQAPVIMMSQNRQEAKDRLRSEQDYRINLKAELEIKALHDKLDHILLQQWQHILEIQQIQSEILDELTIRK